MSLVEFARQELEEAGYFDREKDFYGGMTGKSVLELIECFSKQGHSGMSAGIVRQLFNKLANYNPITAILDTPESWMEVSQGTYQHKKLSGLFKNSIDGQAYYLDAIVFQGPEDYDTFTGTVEDITSRQYVKSWPFIPKTFKIDLTKTDYDPEIHKDLSKVVEGAGKYVYAVKDREQLLEVFDYYNQYKK